ncbi:hypothetical protein EHF33_20235 (plasmid) [Deinococcus psychrotolerans]|uniref:Uncharacterized protein n=1 Tax=Deinococcus psychrotolerans TaxID=2489213 RepID=A0A3G8YKN6_9DEIO|nr:hypothetical protein [Deinococcus psychrotolerans]AZI45240.1 hypothetical protein EHF33_20235 [Deinococcus psychrotolerans]
MIYGINDDLELICLPAAEMTDACTLRALVCGTKMTFGELRRLVSPDAYDFVAEAKQQVSQNEGEGETEQDGHEGETQALDASPDYQDDDEIFGTEDEESLMEVLLQYPTAQQVMAEMPEFGTLGTEDISPVNGAFRLILADQEQAFLQEMQRRGIAVIRNDAAAALTSTYDASSVSDLFQVVSQF